jgi:hypothetical protein
VGPTHQPLPPSTCRCFPRSTCAAHTHDTSSPLSSPVRVPLATHVPRPEGQARSTCHRNLTPPSILTAPSGPSHRNCPRSRAPSRRSPSPFPRKSQAQNWPVVPPPRSNKPTDLELSARHSTTRKRSPLSLQAGCHRHLCSSSIGEQTLCSTTTFSSTPAAIYVSGSTRCRGLASSAAVDTSTIQSVTMPHRPQTAPPLSVSSS